MDESVKQDEPRGRGGAAAAAIIIVGLILGYPLSLGPVAYLVERSGMSSSGESKLLHALEKFYAPAIYVIETESPIQQPYLSYLDLFVPTHTTTAVPASAPIPYVPPPPLPDELPPADTAPSTDRDL